MSPDFIFLTSWSLYCVLETLYLEYELYFNVFMLFRAMSSHMVLLTRFYLHCRVQTHHLENDVLRNARATGRRSTTPEPQNMTEAQTPMKGDVAPGKTDFAGTTEPKVLCLGDTYKCPLAGDPGRRRPVTESRGVRRIRRTDQSTDWGALSPGQAVDERRRCKHPSSGLSS